MPNCFSLTRKSDPQSGPVPLSKIDEEMCKHFNAICDPERYYMYWFDWIGFRLAMGRSLEYLQGYFAGAAEHAGEAQDRVEFDRLESIARWLNENFTSDA